MAAWIIEPRMSDVIANQPESVTVNESLYQLGNFINTIRAARYGVAWSQIAIDVQKSGPKAGAFVVTTHPSFDATIDQIIAEGGVTNVTKV